MATTRTGNYSLKPKVEFPTFDRHDHNPVFDHFSGFGGYNTNTLEHYWPLEELSLQQYCYDDALPSTEAFPLASDYTSYASLDIENGHADVTQDDSSLIDYANVNVNFWSELDSLFEPKPQAPPLLCNGENSTGKMKQVKRTKKGRSEEKACNSISNVLTREIISEYFYMPITQAAKELNVGLTLLKKRCRELGISRWPHRKLTSLQTLIKSLQNGKGSEGKLKEVIDSLERERKSLEEMPDMELGHGTKRLRQAYFKANYKRRKLLGFMETKNDHSFVDNQSTNMIGGDNEASSYRNDEPDEEDEEIKSLLYDSFSSDSNMLL